MVYSAIAINSNYASKIEVSDKPNTLPAQIGNKTECGLLGFVDHLGGNYTTIRDANPTKDYVHVYTFNSSRKSMSVAIHHPTIPGAIRLFCKGASEMVLNKCKYIMRGDTIEDFTPANYNHINQTVIEPMASEGLRTICVSYKDYIPAGNKIGKGDELLSDQLDWDQVLIIFKKQWNHMIVGSEHKQKNFWMVN